MLWGQNVLTKMKMAISEIIYFVRTFLVPMHEENGLCVCVWVCLEEDVVVPGSAAVAHPGPEKERERERIKDIRMKGRQN